MNRCNDFGDGTCAKGKHAPRSCDELGLCQERYPACGGCMTAPVASGPRYRFAPGVVQGYRVGFFGTAQQRRELRRWAEVGAWLMAGVGLVALTVGLIAGMTA